MSGNDDSPIQRQRVALAAHRLAPGILVEFDGNAGLENVRFRVFGADRAILIPPSAPYLWSDIKSKSDAELETMLHVLSDGKI